MSIMQRLTLIGLYNYDNKLFEDLSLPEAYDKNVFIESLMIEHGEKLVLYSDYDFMKYSIGAWGRKWNLELERIAEALKAEYNPIWNYDRYEEINDVNNKSHDLNTKNNIDSVSETGSSINNTSDTVTNTNNSQSGSSDTNTTTNRNHTNNADFDITKENITSGDVEHLISADNESTYQPQSKDITNVGKQRNPPTAQKTTSKKIPPATKTAQQKTTPKKIRFSLYNRKPIRDHPPRRMMKETLTLQKMKILHRITTRICGVM